MNDYAFNARATYAVKSDQFFRVYPDKDVIYFIRISGQPLAAGVAAGLQAQLGAVGRSMGSGLIRKSKKKIQDAAKLADMKDFRTQVHTNKHSFALPVIKIISSSIDPPKIISGHGPHEGVWNLSFVDGKKLKLQFEEVDDMKRALNHLPQILGAKLAINVAWG